LVFFSCPPCHISGSHDFFGSRYFGSVSSAKRVGLLDGPFRIRVYHFISKAIKSLVFFPEIDKSVLWSCQNVSENGTFNVDIEISKADYYDALNWLKENSLKEQGVIQPPYISLFYMRSDRIGFWDPKTDQHPMYMHTGYWPIGQSKLERSAGRFAFEKSLGIANGNVGAHGRMHYITLDEKTILDIKFNYPQYELILTENQKLNFPKLYANKTFSVYKIVEN
jgi:hypothetical protein